MIERRLRQSGQQRQRLDEIGFEGEEGGGEVAMMMMINILMKVGEKECNILKF